MAVYESEVDFSRLIADLAEIFPVVGAIPEFLMWGKCEKGTRKKAKKK